MYFLTYLFWRILIVVRTYIRKWTLLLRLVRFQRSIQRQHFWNQTIGKMFRAYFLILSIITTSVISLTIHQGKEVSYSKFFFPIMHSVEISLILYRSDFTWNQFWGFLKCKISHFNTFRDSVFWFLWFFALFQGWNLPNEQNSKPLKWQKRQFLHF